MKAILVYMNDCSFCLDYIIRTLSSSGISVTAYERHSFPKKKVAGYDLVVVLAGDGTFLKIAHYVDNIPMVGVNATPHRRVGFFCKTTPETLLPTILKWKKGKLKPKKLMRLEATLTHKGKKIKLLLALNEYFIGCQRTYHVSRYWVSFNGKSEYQKTSGLIIGTPAGSTAWTYTAGGKKIELNRNAIQYVAREPVQSSIVKMKMLKGILLQNSTITVQSDMSDGIVVVDSYPYTYPFVKGDRIIIQKSKKPLYFIS